MMRIAKTLIVLVPLVCAVGWYELVYDQVPDPYLDEEFHIRQAQSYLEGRWDIWDPKITTPPGLYLASWVFAYGARSLGFEDMVIGEGRDLRLINLVAAVVLAKILDLILAKTRTSPTDRGKESDTQVFERRHVLANMLLFPVLFFFYGLYYTDVLSVLSVMITYLMYLRQDSLFVLISGLISLSIRQTNIFWIGVYLGALEAKRLLTRRIEVSSPAPLSDILEKSGAGGAVYDPLIADATFEDYFKTALSYGVALLSNLHIVLRSLWAYGLLFAVFTQFVLWNGSVALGDKTNHIPAIHLAQMLYIWPYMTFFSLPLLYPYLLQRIIPSKYLPARMQTRDTQIFRPRFIIAMPIVVLMLAIVHFNTIIHPFSLADNRHYVFYVLRYLNRFPEVKYLVTPVYFLCAWAILMPLSQPAVQNTDANRTGETSNKKDAVSTSPAKDLQKTDLEASWLLIWMCTTALSLITAPLIEPRYCILPWMMWRLQMPSSGRNAAGETERKKAAQIAPWVLHDKRLWLEMGWFLLINIATGYVFLYRGFEWKQEPGRTQRFMW